MANSSVYEKIINKGQEEANEILRLGQEKANSITEQILTETDLKVRKILDDNTIKNGDLIITKKSELEQYSKQKILSNQKALINDTFNQAIKKLQDINNEDLTKLVVKYLKHEKLEGNEILKVNKNDFIKYQSIFSSNKDKQLDLLSKLINKDFHLQLSNESVEISGGFIIEGKYYDVDCSYESIIKELSSLLETKIANKLFGE